MLEDNYKNIDEKRSPFRVILPIVVIALIICTLLAYTYVQRKKVVSSAEYVTNQMAGYISENIANEIEYGESSIRFAAVTVAQSMTSSTIENPAKTILPLVNNTPFGNIEYIREDGMNVMNVGEPFDASDRTYYIEGIQGRTGIWNNYHPKTSKETLMNFYTPLFYDNKIAGVITGYIEANTQLVPLFQTELYGQPIYGVLIDDDNMVICSTVESEYIKDLTLDMFMDGFRVAQEDKPRVYEILSKATEEPVSYKEPRGEGRICVSVIPGMNWKVAIIVPEASFDAIIVEYTRDSVVTTVVIGLILIAYAAYVLLRNVRKRVELAEQNRSMSNALTETHGVVASANMGIWRIELVDGEEPRMYVDDTMARLLGIEGKDRSPEKTYTDWYSNVVPDAVESVLASVDKMKQGEFDENTYLWRHPILGERYVRCGGTSTKIPGGIALRGYHYDVDDVVREDQAKVVMLQAALDEKNEYYSTLGALGDIFYSMHVIDLAEDSVMAFTAQNAVKDIVSHKFGAKEMMIQIMSRVITEEFREAALEFTDLTTLPERLQGKMIISRQLLGQNVGWILASFITMETDEAGKATKVIYTTRVIDEEKKQEEKLVKKAQTDELTGLLNRRSYEEDIYAHNDTPEDENFIYISMDVNGLKVVNDSLGHTAGDELLIGACQCMKDALGSYGRIYRTGGDEFVAILFCSDSEIKEVLNNFDNIIKNWSGKIVKSLTISYGWISKYEDLSASVRQLGAVAEQRMYAAKDEHYRKMGVDRRGQQDAHRVLCELYTKILKINLTDDSYLIVNMDSTEQTKEKGFSDKISEWLSSFGTTGQVHPDDLEEYLKLTSPAYMKDYFDGDKTSLHIFYRRRYGDSFKRVMMEIIPANDYSPENQSLYLYVKEIDK